MAIVNFLNRQLQASGYDEVGIGGFKLFAHVDQTIQYSSQSPINYVEDGSFIQDHIILDPTKLILTGNISDITLRRTIIDETVSRLNEEIGLITRYLPDRTPSQIQDAQSLINDVQNSIDGINAAIADGEQILDFFGLNLPFGQSKTIQELFLDAMEAIHFGKQLIDIEMPYRVYTNMRITNISIAKDNKNDALSYTITANEIRKVRTTATNIPPQVKRKSNNVKAQGSNKQTIGTQAGTQLSNTQTANRLASVGL